MTEVSPSGRYEITLETFKGRPATCKPQSRGSHPTTLEWLIALSLQRLSIQPRHPASEISAVTDVVGNN